MSTYDIKSGDTLGGIATANNTNVQALQTANPNITDPNKIYAGQTLTLPTIDAKTLTSPTQTPQLPQYGGTPTADISAIPSLTDVQNTANNTTTAAPTAAETTNTSLSSRIMELAGKLGLKTQATATAEQTAGVDTYTKQLNDINSQITQLQNDSAAYKIKVAGQGGVSNNVIGTQINEEERNRTIKALQLSSLAKAAQGNLATAHDAADRAVKAEFQPAEDELKYLQTAYTLNKDALEREDKKKADALALQLDERKRLLDNQKEDKKIILGWAAEAFKNGADSLTVQRAQLAKTPQEALNLLGRYFVDPNAKQKALDDHMVAQANISKTYADIRKINADINASKPINLSTIAPGAGPDVKNATVLSALIGSSKIGQGTKTQLANILSVINSVGDVATANPKANFTGVNPINKILNLTIPFTDIGIVPFRQVFKQEGSIQNSQYVDAINLKVQQWASGASLTAEQIKQVGRLVPLITDTDTNFAIKMSGLTNFMLTQVKSQLQSEGISYEPEKINYYPKNVVTAPDGQQIQITDL